MLSRSVAILIGSWLPMLAIMLPLGRFHTANAIVAGILGTLLSLAALADDRGRIGAAIVGAWVALSPFIFAATLLEKVVTVSWGITMFACMIGPFSHAPAVTVTGAPEKAQPAEDEPELARAA